MRRLTVGLVVSAFFLGAGLSGEPGQRTLGRTIPYSVGRALPDRAGEWARAAQIQMYNPGDLWEYIDGAAEQFLTYGFQDLATTKYTSDQTRTVAVAEVYRMEDARGAFGIYRQEVSPKARPVALGVEGRASSNTIRFWLAEFYVKLTLPPGGGRQRELEVLGAAIAKGLGAPGTMPDEVRWFPPAGQVPDSVKYIPADALGQASFTHAFEAKYEGPGEGSSALIVPFESDAAAAAALTRYETFLARAKGKAKVAAPGDGGFSATDSFQGLILAVRAGSRLVISLGAADDRAAGSIVAEIIKRLPAKPGGQPRKEGGS
jgi:hypothetical protein